MRILSPVHAGYLRDEYANYSIIWVTTPAPTVRPPSRIANFSPASHAIVLSSSTIDLDVVARHHHLSRLRAGITEPVTSVVRK
jgi:hypothetical protein